MSTLDLVQVTFQPGAPGWRAQVPVNGTCCCLRESTRRSVKFFHVPTLSLVKCEHGAPEVRYAKLLSPTEGWPALAAQLARAREEHVARGAQHPGAYVDHVLTLIKETHMTPPDLNTMSLKQLTEYYNANAASTVKKFTDKKTALRRVRAMLAEGGQLKSLPSVQPSEPKENEMAAKKKTGRAGKFTSDSRVVWDKPLAEIFREGSEVFARWGKAKSGMTVSELMEKGVRRGDILYAKKRDQLTVVGA